MFIDIKIHNQMEKRRGASQDLVEERHIYIYSRKDSRKEKH